VQRPVYFISEFLSESKVRYPTIHKVLYGILITFRKLRHYFDAYNNLVISDFPLADILHNRDATGHISKWAVELGALILDFKPKTAIKSQALVNFMAEWRENQVEAPTNQLEHWVLYLTAHSSSVAVVWEYFSSIREKNSSSTYCKYHSRSLTMRPSKRHYCMGYAWQSFYASSDYSYTVIPYWWFKKSTRSGTSTRTP
jgi:hypothetical protein